MLNNIPVKNKDNCIVTLFIIKHRLSTPFPCSEEDLEIMCFYKIIEYNHDSGAWALSTIGEFKEFKERIPEYRSMFSRKALGIDKASTPKAVEEKLLKFHEEYPDYTMSDIIEAAKLHIQETNNPIYIKKANNFLFKKEGNSTWESVAAEYCERVKELKTTNQALFI